MRYHLTILDKPLPGKEILILPEFVLGFSLVFITGIILLNYDRYKEAPYALFIKNIALVSASINLSIAFLAAIYNYLDFKLSESDYNANSYEAVIILNSFTYFFKAMVGILIILSLLLLRRHWDIKNDAGVVAWERPLLMLASLLFMFLLISSNNLLVTFILIEGLSVCLYFILASELRGNSFTAVLMYFLLGSVSSILFGYALLRTYWTVGSFDYDDIHYYFLSISECDIQEASISYTIMLSTLLFSLFFKIAVFPSYFWVRDLYCAATTPTVFILAVPVKTVIFLVFFRIVAYPFLGLSSLWVNLVLFSGLGSIILGCFIALRARRVHAFIAGSGINHMGFILCGVGCQSNLGFTSALFYLITYVITSSAFFLLLTIIKNKCGKSITYIRDLYQVQNDPFIQGALFVILFSFAGIPPLVGFFSKALILFALYNKGYTLLCFIIVITALISTYYYLRLICFSSFKQNYIGIRSRTKKLCAVPRYENKPVVFEFGPYNYLATLSIHNKIVDLKDQFNKKIKPYFFVLFRSDNTKKKDHYLLFSLLFYILIFIPFHGAVWDFCFQLQLTAGNTASEFEMVPFYFY